MSKKIAIIGAGGHGKVIGEIALLNNYEIIDFFDDRIKEINNFPFKIIDTLISIEKYINNYDSFFVAIGDNKIRKDKMNWLNKFNVNCVTLIHPKSTISKFSSILEGSCVMANAVINPGCQIKQGAIINTSASIDHDCLIEEFTHISPNCSISGNVKIGKSSHIGTGTAIHPGTNIGNYVKTAVGSKVFKDISDNNVYKN